MSQSESFDAACLVLRLLPIADTCYARQCPLLGELIVGLFLFPRLLLFRHFQKVLRHLNKARFVQRIYHPFGQAQTLSRISAIVL